MPSQHAAESLHRFQTFIQFEELSLKKIADLSTLFSAARREQTLYFIKRQAQLLGLLDELHSLDVLTRKEPKAAGRAFRPRQELKPFVVPQRIDAHAAAFRYFADSESVAQLKPRQPV